jgi:hypothetical protein
MFCPFARYCVSILVLSGGLFGCGPAKHPDSANAAALHVGVPPGLQGARLLYQRPDGIYLRILGQSQSVRLVEDAVYPRWAPDGQSFAFLRGDRILHFGLSDKSERLLATAERVRAVAFAPAGDRVLFAVGRSIQSVALRGGPVATVATGPEFMELDVSDQGDFFAATVKSFGYRVVRFDLPSGRQTEMARGCSASVSPDGRLITANQAGHVQLALRDSQTGADRGQVTAPAGLKFDNQKWSNHPDWIAAIAEGKRPDVLVLNVRDGQACRVTDDGDADRPDLFVE